MKKISGTTQKFRQGIVFDSSLLTGTPIANRRQRGMNPYYYLFYKLSQFVNSNGKNELGPITAISFLIGLNIMGIYGTILHITEKNSHGLYKIIFIAICIILFITNSILFLNKKRVLEINDRYKGESKTNKKVGNFLVIIYAILSLGLIILG